MQTKRIVILTDLGQVLPINVKWSARFSTPTNIARYVKPLIGSPFVAAICRGFVWTGHSDWAYKYDSLPIWRDTMSMQENNDTLWL
uniref:Uncharacterized protein n=1 Tax=viral metagenome TaxID=1070528 RepID=A0A6M3JJF2_9ZZZZ